MGHEFLDNMFGGMDFFIGGKKVGTVTEIKDDIIEDSSKTKAVENLGSLKKEFTFNVDAIEDVTSALKDISVQALAKEADGSMKAWFNQNNNTIVTDTSLYAVKINDLIEQFPTNILVEIRQKILIRHPEKIIADFKDFRASYISTGCMIRNMTSLSEDLTHLDVIDWNGYLIKIADTKAEFKLSNGQYLIIKH